LQNDAESVLVSRGTVSAGESAPISQICSVAVGPYGMLLSEGRLRPRSSTAWMT
jgi:hypothetical protein